MAAVIVVPTSVARGIVRAGSTMLPLGTVAASSPRNAQSVSAAVAETPPVTARTPLAGISDVRRRTRTRRPRRSPPAARSSARWSLPAPTGRSHPHDVDADQQPHGGRPRSRRRRSAIGPAPGQTDPGSRRTRPRARRGWTRSKSSSPTPPGSRRSRRKRVACRRTGPPAAGSIRASRANTSASASAPTVDTIHPARLKPAIGRQRRWQQEDARADHVAHDQRDRHPEANGGGVGHACVGAVSRRDIAIAQLPAAAARAPVRPQ